MCEIDGSAEFEKISLSDEETKCVSVKVNTYATNVLIDLKPVTQKPDLRLTQIVTKKWLPTFHPYNKFACHCSGNLLAFATDNDDGSANLWVYDRLSKRENSVTFEASIADVSFASTEKLLLAAIDVKGEYRVYTIEDTASELIFCERFAQKSENEISPFNHITWKSLPTDAIQKRTLLAAVQMKKITIFNFLSLEDIAAGDCCQPEETSTVYDENNITMLRFSPDASVFAFSTENGVVKFYSFEITKNKAELVFEWAPNPGKCITFLLFLNDAETTDIKDDSAGNSKFWKYVVIGYNRNSEIQIWDSLKWSLHQSITFENVTAGVNSIFNAAADEKGHFLLLANVNSPAAYVLKFDKPHDVILVSSISAISLCDVPLDICMTEMQPITQDSAMNIANFEDVCGVPFIYDKVCVNFKLIVLFSSMLAEVECPACFTTNSATQSEPLDPNEQTAACDTSEDDVYLPAIQYPADSQDIHCKLDAIQKSLESVAFSLNKLNETLCRKMASKAEADRSMLQADMEFKSKLEESLRSVVSNSLGPIERTRQALHQDITARVNSLDLTAKQAVIQAIRSRNVIDSLTQILGTTLQTSATNAYLDMFQSIILPSFERAVGQMYQQVNEVFKNGTNEYLVHAVSDVKNLMEGYVKSLKLDTCNIDGKKSEDFVIVSKSDFENMISISLTKLLPVIKEDIQTSIREELRLCFLLDQNDAELFDETQFNKIISIAKTDGFNEAFREVLSMKNLKMLVAVCEHFNVSDVFSSSTSSPCDAVILSLINQLAVDLSTSTEIKLTYLQYALAHINLQDESVKTHLNSIITFLIDKVSAYLASNQDTEHARTLKLLLLAAQGLRKSS